ncbi:uncharacterized protein LAESUDRAFT_713585 [Laetiporus sulphureus 93-53]|uniref:Protein Zds1 C-terminal domain-containing protein n=1 Tax=Laetiporus sulphureus 93-53 TaxID=1314785 RepID=A0A165EPD6_9APHY|nr:uncharacterized protein LAESUDRAFT_713585 [Laetiporus sulphureus 93-53]KZT07487.1 hypothetical protein LAESUDRAFT_713585 [Laetiporus sulphureus 93-53]
MQPSEYEIQREVEALRDLRRRSTAGEPILDPDLPSASSQASSNPAYWPTEDSSSGSSHESSDHDSTDVASDPFHLFWVPARLHPEIAPAEFRQFLKEHARTPVDETGTLERSASSGSVGLGRKRSMLSRQYSPSPNDGVEEEKVVPIRRNRSSIYARSGPQLTISDLQKLEELAEEASKSHDPTRLRNVLKRSLSLNIAPSVIDQMDDIPELADDADAPIIVPRPGQVLRRSARTKIRKPGMTGEGSHRFTATRSRRKSETRSATMHESRASISSDISSSDHDHTDYSRRPRSETEAPAANQTRPESFSMEALIYDAYATEEPEEEAPPRTTTPEPSVESTASPPSTSSHSDPSEHAPEQPAPAVPPPVLHHPQPQRAVAPAVPEEPPTLTRSPSPEPTSVAPPATVASPPIAAPQPRPSLQESPVYHPPSPSPSEQRREKDKKGGLFAKWGSDKNSKKKEKEKEKEPGFFGSLFGAKKKQEESAPSMGMGASGRETAAALLGSSKTSKSHTPSPSPQLAGMYARYPIHVERAIYRLSHIKLANPRRPLYEQVLISNLMFWYLGVINKTQTAQISNDAAAPQPQIGSQSTPSRDQLEREQMQREERERAERERLEREQEQKRRGLTKQSSAGSPAPGARRAEMPVRGPQYEMQHRVMEQEYNQPPMANGSANPSLGRTTSASNSAGSSGYQSSPSTRSSSAAPAPFTVGSTQPQTQVNGGFYNMDNSSIPTQQYPSVVMGGQLPPGAMPPVAVEQGWVSPAGSPQPVTSRGQSSASPPRSSISESAAPQPSATRRARSPPPNRYTPAQEKQSYGGGGVKIPSRSLSASAAPPVQTMQHVNGKLRKGVSAHAVSTNYLHSEDEEIPLALWQQQQRRK